MKRRLPIFVIAIAILAIGVWPDEPDPPAPAATDGLRPVYPDSGRPTAAVPEGSTAAAARSPAAASRNDLSAQAPATAETASPSCPELARLAENSDVSFALASDRDVDETLCATMSRLVTGETMPALPGSNGFDISAAWDAHPARRLAAESDDPAWSRDMESRIISTIQRRLGFPVLSLEVECRATLCGLVFDSVTEVRLGGNYNRIAGQLADELGFGSFYGGRSNRGRSTAFVSIYLGDWDTLR